MTSKRCVNCYELVSNQGLDFCSQECEDEFKSGCDAELLANLQLGVTDKSTSESQPERKDEVKEFSALLENDGPDGKVTKD